MADPDRSGPLPAEIVVASTNAGKLREIRAILGTLGMHVLPLAEFLCDPVEELGRSYTENALIKGRHAAAVAGRAALADDSGLEVDALGGAPGIYSARYAGPGASDRDNVDRLLTTMAEVPEGRRGARFRCVMVYLRNALDLEPIVAEGVWEGRVLLAPRGREGFGYDPVFYVPEAGCSAAELPAEIKNRLSHRAQALHGLCAQLSYTHPDGLGRRHCG